MNKTKQMLVALLAIVVIGAGGFWLYDNNQGSQEVTNNNTQTTQQPVDSEENANSSIVSYEGVTGKTALELLKEIKEVETEDSGFGEFVTSIDGTQADSGEEYWSFYVNGEYASEGAGTYQTTDGELIEWKLEQLEL